jgi:RNA polymerase sigma-70 factor (ECF subfamily)
MGIAVEWKQSARAFAMESRDVYGAPDVSGEEGPIALASLRDAADERVVEAARSGQHEAFEELVRRYRNQVFALSFHFLRNREEAWDLSQEVFIKAHRALGRFRGDAAFKTWLMRITANQCRDYLKKRRLDTVAFDPSRLPEQEVNPADAPDRRAEASELGKTIIEAVDSLPHKHRTAFVLREFQGLSYAEMAEAMDCSMGTVMSRLHHARKKLQKKLQTLGVAEETSDE